MKNVKTTKKQYTVSVNLPVQIIKEGKIFVAYCPALDIATQGETLEEANKMFAEMVEAFIDELINTGKLEEALRDLGWKVSPTTKQWQVPDRTLIQESEQEISIPVPCNA